MRNAAILVVALTVLAGLALGHFKITGDGQGGAQLEVMAPGGAPLFNAQLGIKAKAQAAAAPEQPAPAAKQPEPAAKQPEPAAKEPEPAAQPGTAPLQMLCTNKGKTITVSGPAVAENLKAGATLGACPQQPSEQPKKKAVKQAKQPETKESKEPQQIEICLVHMNSTIRVPVSKLNQFLSNGAIVGICTASTTPAPTQPTLTLAPTPQPTLAPTPQPTLAPTPQPTLAPTLAPVVPPPRLAAPQIIRQAKPPAPDCDEPEPAPPVEDCSSSSEDSSDDDAAPPRRARSFRQPAGPRQLPSNVGVNGVDIIPPEQPPTAQRLFKP